MKFYDYFSSSVLLIKITYVNNANLNFTNPLQLIPKKSANQNTSTIPHHSILISY